MFDFNFRHGLVAGLEHETIMVINEDEWAEEEVSTASAWHLHLGFFTVTFIFV